MTPEQRERLEEALTSNFHASPSCRAGIRAALTRIDELEKAVKAADALIGWVDWEDGVVEGYDPSETADELSAWYEACAALEGEQ